MGLPSGRYPLLIFGLPLLAGVVVGFIIGVLPIAWQIIMITFEKGAGFDRAIGYLLLTIPLSMFERQHLKG